MRIKILVILLLLYTGNILYAQKRVYTWNPANIYALIDSARLYESSNPNRSFDYIEQALKGSLESQDKKGEALSYQVLGNINLNLNQSDLAISYYNKAAAIFNSIQNQNQLYQTYNSLANACYQNNDYTNALYYYKEVLNYHRKRNNTNAITETKKNMARVYQQNEQSDKALKLLNEILETESQKGNTREVIEIQNQIGAVYYDEKKEVEALDAYTKSAKIAERSADKEALSNTLKNQSKVLRGSKRYSEELQVRQKRLAIVEEEADVPQVAEENLEIANIYLEQQKPREAIPYIQKSIDLSEKADIIEQKGKALQALSVAYSDQKEYNKALQVYKEYVATTDEIYKKREAEILSGMKIAATLNRKLERMDLVERELRLSQQTINLLQQEQFVVKKEIKAQKVLTYSLVIALIIALLSSYLIYRSGLQKRKANQLLALKSLRSQMNPHFIYNSLNSVNNYISKNDERAANKYLSSFSRLMRAVMDNSKHDFVPLNSEIEILNIYLSLEHSRFEEKFDYSFKVDDSVNTDNYLVPPMLIQPFIENAIWHGLRYLNTKGFLKVAIKDKDVQIEILVEDNGIGRKKSSELKTKHQKDHNSTGMQNIENRMNIIKDLFQINIKVSVEDLQDNEDTGTRVIIHLPKKEYKS